MSATPRIIIVEDDPLIARVMHAALVTDGYRVAVAAGGAELRRDYRARGADLVLLDLNLGDEDGMDLARELVATTPVALIIVTGRANLQDRIEGLDAGADDYVIKPVALAELRARVRAVLRRRGLDLDTNRVLRAGPVTLDPLSRRVRCEGCDGEVQLTQIESSILSELMRHQGRAVGRPQLRQQQAVEPGDRAVDVHIGRIRRKFQDAGIQVVVIWPVRGHGYRLRIEPTD